MKTLFSKQEVLKLAEKKVDRLIRLTEDLVKIRSPTGHEKEAAEFFGDYLKGMGLRVEMQEPRPGRPQAIGTWKGRGGGSSLMFNGHLDTDPVCGNWTRDPYSPIVEEGKLYGIGATNMKAGVAAMVTAVDVLQSAGVELPGDIVVAGVMGELQGGIGSKHLIDSGIRTDAAIIPEPTDLNIMTVNAGILRARIATFGRTSHIAWKHEGVNAVEKMCKVIAGLERIEFSRGGERRGEFEGLPACNVGSIRGGIGKDYYDGRPPVVPDYCTIRIDVRFGTDMTAESILQDIRGMFDRLTAGDPQFQAEVEPDPDFITRPAYSIPKDSRVVKTIAENHRLVTGREPVVGVMDPAYRFTATDANWLYTVARIEAVPYGPVAVWQVYVPDEYVLIEDVATSMKVMCLSALDICAAERTSRPS